LPELLVLEFQIGGKFTTNSQLMKKY